MRTEVFITLQKNEKLLNINVWDIIQKSLLADRMLKSTVM